MSEDHRVAAVILAAGASRRYGSPKQLVVVDGRTLLEHAIDTAMEVGLAPVVAVVPVWLSRPARLDDDRLLWIRGEASSLFDRVMERGLKALTLVLQAGGFGIVVFDLADAPAQALNRIPFTTWLRIQRTIEGSETVCLLLAPHAMTRSAGGLTLTCEGRPEWEGDAGRSRRLAGLEMGVRVVSPRRQVEGDVACSARL